MLHATNLEMRVTLQLWALLCAEHPAVAQQTLESQLKPTEN